MFRRELCEVREMFLSCLCHQGGTTPEIGRLLDEGEFESESEVGDGFEFGFGSSWGGSCGFV